MPGTDGMQTAARIREKDSETVIVFLTRMAQYAIKGYEVKALDFIVKPVDYNSFSVKLGRAIDAAKRKQEYRIEIRMDGDCLWLPVSAVYSIEVNKHELTYHTAQGNFTARGSLSELEGKLRPHGFRTCSRYCLVNMKHVTGIYDWFILIGKEKIEVSRRKRKELLRRCWIFTEEMRMLKFWMDVYFECNFFVYLLIAACLLCFPAPRRKLFWLRMLPSALAGIFLTYIYSLLPHWIGYDGFPYTLYYCCKYFFCFALVCGCVWFSFAPPSPRYSITASAATPCSTWAMLFS